MTFLYVYDVKNSTNLLKLTKATIKGVKRI